MWYANTLTVVVGSWMLMRYRPRLRLANFATWRQLAHYGRNILGAHTVQLAFGYLDTLTVGRTLRPRSSGGTARPPGWRSCPPRRPRTWRARPCSRRSPGCATTSRGCAPAFLEAMRYIALLAFPLFAILAVISEPFVVVLFGEQWRPTGPVLAVMMLWVLPLSLFEPSMELFKAIGQPGRVFRLAFVKFVSFAVYLSAASGPSTGSPWSASPRASACRRPSASRSRSRACAAPPARRRSQLWAAVRPAVGGALVSAVAMYLLSELVMGEHLDTVQLQHRRGRSRARCCRSC